AGCGLDLFGRGHLGKDRKDARIAQTRDRADELRLGLKLGGSLDQSMKLLLDHSQLGPHSLQNRLDRTHAGLADRKRAFSAAPLHRDHLLELSAPASEPEDLAMSLALHRPGLRIPLSGELSDELGIRL